MVVVNLFVGVSVHEFMQVNEVDSPHLLIVQLLNHIPQLVRHLREEGRAELGAEDPSCLADRVIVDLNRADLGAELSCPSLLRHSHESPDSLGI